MTLTVPEQLERDDQVIVVSVAAVYVFGENLQGSVKVNATLESGGRRESLTFYDEKKSLVRQLFINIWNYFFASAPSLIAIIAINVWNVKASYNDFDPIGIVSPA